MGLSESAVPGRTFEGGPGAERVSAWFCWIAAGAGLVLALPWLAALGWSLVRCESRPNTGPPDRALIAWSYVAIAVGLSVAVFGALPAIRLQQRTDGQGIEPAPWASVDTELGAIVGCALASQLAAVVAALIRRRVPEQ